MKTTTSPSTAYAAQSSRRAYYSLQSTLYAVGTLASSLYPVDDKLAAKAEKMRVALLKFLKETEAIKVELAGE